MSQYWKNYWDTPIDTLDEQSQVGRTREKRPIDADTFARTVDFVAKEMRLDGDSTLLELCCGNGLFTMPLAQRIRSVTAVDFSQPLLAVLEKKIAASNIRNIEVEHKDVTCYSAGNERNFSHVLLYFAIQHFSEAEAIRVFETAHSALAAPDGQRRKVGVFYVGDVPDRARLWQFANTPEYLRMYFDAVKDERPSIGNWFLKEDLLHLAEYAGFHCAEIVEQPQWQINSRFRFDLRCMA
jgi:cyclopropane fatty-acyl-phospholipid synthase-like methyltransferase